MRIACIIYRRHGRVTKKNEEITEPKKQNLSSISDYQSIDEKYVRTELPSETLSNTG